MSYGNMRSFQKERDRALEQATIKGTLQKNGCSNEERLGLKRELYNTYVDAYEQRTEVGLVLYQPYLDAFKRLVQSPNVIDLGSGPGRDARYLQHQGLQVLCIDFAAEALKKCSRKGLETRCLNYETELDAAINEATIGGVWTNCSLTTTPRANIEEILNVLYRKLLPGAPAFFGFIESTWEEEGWINPGDKYSIPRFRFRSNRRAIAEMLQRHGFSMYSLQVLSRQASGKNTYLNYLCRKAENDGG